MSKDIRSFFITTKTAPQSSTISKRKALQISSDEDDSKNVSVTSKKISKTTSSKVKKRRVIESDDDEISPQKKSPAKTKSPIKSQKKTTPSKTINKTSQEDLKKMFGNIPTRVERKRAPKQADDLTTESIVLSDDEINKSLMDLDVLIESSSKKLETVKDRSCNSMKLSPPKLNKLKDEFTNKIKSEKIQSLKKIASPTKRSPVEVVKTPTQDDSRKKSLNSSFERKPHKKVDLETSVLSDEERNERKRMAAILYQKYKNRQGCPNPGSKEVPKGNPNCLAGNTFVVTGVLESIEREECCNLIKELGGKIVQTVGKRLNYLVAGEDAGPKKLANADEFGVSILNEDELFNLIRQKSGKLDTKSIGSPKKEVLEKTKIPSPTQKIKKEISPQKPLKKTPEKRKLKEEDEANNNIKTESPKKIKTEPNTKEIVKAEIIQQKQNKKSIDIETLAWVDKYKPKSTNEIIGQQGAASNCVKLRNWLSKWYINHNGKIKLQKPNPWAKNDDGSFYKAALLSGPPGVGKTTTATLVCKELGFDLVEFNASDTRSKKLLKEEVSELLSNKSLHGYFNGLSDSVTKKHVLIMDEVDGMAGNEDRGGIQELIALIKDSSIPIICMCNDRNHQKMRSLVNYCYDLRFNKPRLEQIKGAIMSICFKEKFKLPGSKIEEIILATNNDIRQTVNHLSLLSASKELVSDQNNKNKIATKDLKLGPWEVVRKVFSADERKNMNMNEKTELFFHDYSLGPLFVQQNYLSVAPKVPKSEVPQQVALAADALSLGDLIEKRIRSNSAWSLLPVQAMFSCVFPGDFMQGHITGQINFPGWLGKYSRGNKRSRLAQEIHDHTRCRTSGSRLSIRLDYAPFLLDAIVRPLKRKGLEGVNESLNVIKEYRLLREDIESLIELSSWPGKKNPMDSVDSKVKAALTRAYNKDVMAYTYSAVTGVKKKKLEGADELAEFGNNEEDGETISPISDNEEDDKLENDTLIKAKKKPAAKPSSSSGNKTKKSEATLKQTKTKKTSK